MNSSTVGCRQASSSITWVLIAATPYSFQYGCKYVRKDSIIFMKIKKRSIKSVHLGKLRSLAHEGGSTALVSRILRQKTVHLRLEVGRGQEGILRRIQLRQTRLRQSSKASYCLRQSLNTEKKQKTIPFNRSMKSTIKMIIS